MSNEIVGALYPANFPLNYSKLAQFTLSSKRIHRDEIITEFKINHELGKYYNLLSASEEIDGVFDNIIQDIISQYPDNYKVSAYLEQKDLEFKIFIPPQFVRNFNAGTILTIINKVVQSNKQFLLDGEMKLEVCVTENIYGMGGRNPNDRRPPKQLNAISKSKHSTVTLKNIDNSCGYRAIFVAKYYTDNKDNLQSVLWERVRKDAFSAQTKGAKLIADIAGLNFEIPVSIDNIVQIQSAFYDYQIIIIDALFKHNLIYRGPNAEKKIYKEFIDNHFNAVTNIKGYMGLAYYCAICHIAYQNKFDHKCKFACEKCYSICDKQENFKIKCNDCHRSFFGNDCYDNHLTNALCAKIKKCDICKVTYKKSHICEQYKCKVCNVKYSKQPHMCFMGPRNEMDLTDEDELPKVILSYDIESTQDNGVHKAMLLISKVSCDFCFGRTQKCFTCSEKIFFGYSCVNDFVKYLFLDLAHNVPKNTVIYAFAHNARGYDSHFILRELWSLLLDKVNIVMTGRNILCIKVGKVRLVDSLSFFQQPLSTLPKAFGLDVNIRKGELPHLFNSPENWNYNGKIPAIHYYKPEAKKFKAAGELRKWHNDKINDPSYVFNFKNELIEYCRNDVDILDQCINTFRRQFKSITNIDPITRCFTLASIGLEVFRAKYLADEILGVTKVDGYNTGADERNSISRLCLLDWLQYSENIKIEREYRVANKYADGYNKESNTLYEFLGCHYHGCLCKKWNRDAPVVNQKLSYNDVYAKTMKKFEI